MALPELVFFLVEEDISRALSRGEEVGSRDPETLEERGGYEMGSVGLDGRERAELELGVRWEAEELLAEVLEFRVELLGNSMVGDEEESPSPASFSNG